MKDLNLKAAVWSLFTSKEFIEAAAREAEETAEWFGALGVSQGVADFGRNNHIYDTLKRRAQDFRRGAELAKHDDYSLIWETANSIRGDARGFIEQPLHSWMSDEQYKEFDHVRISRLMLNAGLIEYALNNAMAGPLVISTRRQNALNALTMMMAFQMTIFSSRIKLIKMNCRDF